VASGVCLYEVARQRIALGVLRVQQK
jgi:hypothetical protein